VESLDLGWWSCKGWVRRQGSTLRSFTSSIVAASLWLTTAPFKRQSCLLISLAFKITAVLRILRSCPPPTRAVAAAR
jgi:hypothetical protein